MLSTCSPPAAKRATSSARSLDKADATTTKAHRSAGVPPLDPQTVPPAAWRHFAKAFH